MNIKKRIIMVSILLMILTSSEITPVYAITMDISNSTGISSENKKEDSANSSSRSASENWKNKSQNIFKKANSISKERIPKSTKASWGSQGDISKAKETGQEAAREGVNKDVEKSLYKKIKDSKLGYTKGSSISWIGDGISLYYNSKLFDSVSYVETNTGPGGDIDVLLMFYISGSYRLSNNIYALSSDGAIELTYDITTNKGKITRLKNKMVDPSQETLTVSGKINLDDADLYKQKDSGGEKPRYASTSVPATDFVSEVWFKKANYLTPIILEEPTLLSTKTVDEAKLTTTSTLPSTPEQFISVDSHMEGSKLTYLWVTKPDLTKVGIQTVKVKVTDQLDEYLQEKTMDLKVNISKGVENLQSITTKNSTLYVGESWTRKDNFVSATDAEGKDIPWEDTRITANGASVDTSKPGVYTLKYSFKGKEKTSDSSFTVTVKEDQTTVDLQNVSLYVDQPFDLESPFKKVTDKDGKPIKAEDINEYYIDGIKTKTLDTSKPGTHKIKISYLDATNKLKDSETVTVSVNEKQLTANVVAQTVSLGTTIEMLDLKKLVKDVKLADTVLKPVDYTVTINSDFDSGLVGNKTTKVDVKTNDGKQEVTVEVPITVEFGDTVATGSYDYNGKNRLGIAMTLHHGAEPSIVSNPGIVDDNREVHSNFRKKYYAMDWFNFSQENGPVLMTLDLKGESHLEAQGTDLKNDKVKEWGTKQKQVVHYGDVLKSWVLETHKNFIYVDEERQSVNENQKEVYYEITKSGYQPMTFNQLKTNTVTLKNGDSDKAIDESLKQSLDIDNNPSITIERFENKRPDTSIDGEQVINIVVSEKTSTTKIEYIYPVTYQITPVITEEIYTDDSLLIDTKKTEIEQDGSYIPEIKELLEFEGAVYEYQGWLKEDGIIGETQIQAGKPDNMNATTTVKYIYQDIKKLIHVKLPTETLFSVTETKAKKIKSNYYEIENLSETASLEIILSQFKASETDEITFLNTKESDPLEETEAIRLNLMINQVEKISSLNPTSPETKIGQLEPRSRWNLSYDGEYFGKVTEEKKETSHTLVLKFKAEKNK